MASTVRATEGCERNTGRIDERAGFGIRRAVLRWRARPGFITGGLLVLLAIPLLVAVVVLRHPRWYPLWDQATTEMRLRDVGTRHTPLIGLSGLIGLRDDVQGSHPGPLSFYVMWPIYRLFGSSAWAMQVAAAGLNVMALGVVLWVVSWRRSIAVLVGTAGALALLTYAYGAEALTKAWPPYTPMLWWIVLLIASWCVLCNDIRALPVAVFAGCFCVQTHSSYVVLAAGLITLALASIWFTALRRRHDRALLRRTTKWSLLALGIGVALWIPPVLEQLISSPGNLTILWREFRDWTDDPMGLRSAFEVVLVYLNPWRLVTREMFVDTWVISGSRIPGAFVLLAWAGTAILALRLGNRSLVRLHAVVAAALVLAVVTISRLDFVWWYRVQWLWGITVLLLMATGSTLVVLVRQRLKAAGRQRSANTLAWAPLALVVVLTAAFTANASGAAYDRRDSAVLDELVPSMVSTLERQYPDSAKYLLVWSEQSTGALGRGLLNELLRRGFDVGASEYFRSAVRPHRVLSPTDATTVIVLVGGAEIDDWRARPGVKEIAHVKASGSQQAASPDKKPGTAAFAVVPRFWVGDELG